MMIARTVQPPHELEELEQWVSWEYGKLRTSGKREKTPKNPNTRSNAKTNDPRTWATFEKAAAAAEERGHEGTGFVFTEGDPFTGLDLDGCRDPGTGEIEPWAVRIIETFDSYTETSPSQTGVKIYVKGKLPGPGGKRDPVEMYDNGRFFTFTGQRIHGERPEERQKQLEALYRRTFPEKKGEGDRVEAEVGRAVVGGFGGEDEELLERLRRASDGAKFAAVYDGGGLDHHGGDHSRADMWLMGKFAWATANDAERMERLFGRSALARRGKWQERGDYRKRTVEKAISNNGSNAYTGGTPGRTAKNRERAQKRLEAAERWAATQPWDGKNGARNRHLFGALVDTGGLYGKLRGDGDVEFYAAQRDLMPSAGIAGSDSVAEGLKALEKMGVIELKSEGSNGAAAEYIIKIAHSLGTDTTLPPSNSCSSKTPCVDPCAKAMRSVLRKLRKLREKSPQECKERSLDGERRVTVARDRSGGALRQKIGKECALVVEKVYVFAGPEGITAKDLAGLLKKRTNDVRKRHLRRLLEVGLVVEIAEGVYAPPEDLESRLDEELELSGCNEAEKRDLDKYERDRKDVRNRAEARRLCRVGMEPDEIAAALGIGIEDVRRLLRIGRPAEPELVDTDGFTEDPERVEEPEHEEDSGVVQAADEVKPESVPDTSEIESRRRDRQDPREACASVSEIEEIPEAEEESKKAPEREPADVGAAVTLTPGELLDLEAIRAWERENGEFDFSHAACKRMFYGGPIRGRWPGPEELERLALYMQHRKLVTAA